MIRRPIHTPRRPIHTPRHRIAGPPPRRFWALLIALLMTKALAGCATGSRSPPPSPACAAAAPPRSPLVALVAGSGAALALARTALQGEPARVATSIGSSGAIAALRAGAIDVGLSLRPGPPDLRTTLLAHVPLVLAMAGGTHREALSLAQAQAALAAAVAGRAATRPLVWVTREAGDSGLAVLRRVRPQLAALLRRGRTSGAALVAYTDQEQHALLAATPGAVGLVDLGSTRLAGAALRTFPPEDPALELSLYVLTRADASPLSDRIASVLRRFATSEEARRAGYR